MTLKRAFPDASQTWLVDWGGFCDDRAAAPWGMRVTDRIALSLGLVITVVVAVDLIGNDARALMFLLVKFTEMVEWLSFWR